MWLTSRMVAFRGASFTAVLLVASACATSLPSESAQAPPEVSPSSNIVGYWHRAQTCEELLATFTADELANSHRGWLQGNFFGNEEGPTRGDPCMGAEGPLEHSHWFTGDFGFGSHDEHGEEVDGGDYAIVDENTLSFPSHAAEFGYAGEIVVDYEIGEDGLARFTVQLPDECESACQDAYAWALSAFSSGPWAEGDVP